MSTDQNAKRPFLNAALRPSSRSNEFTNGTIDYDQWRSDVLEHLSAVSSATYDELRRLLRGESSVHDAQLRKQLQAMERDGWIVIEKQRKKTTYVNRYSLAYGSAGEDGDASA
jgi:DNA-binding HxlR family transcriptional regulator